MLHRLDDGCLVARAWAQALLAPAHDDEQRVVDGDGQADQRGEELHDDRDVGDGRQRPDQQEGRGIATIAISSGTTAIHEAKTR